MVTAEKISFYESGKIKRIFPLDGRISGFWSELDEKSLLSATNLTFPFGKMALLASTVCYHETGGIRSVTLWPGEMVELTVGGRVYATRVGFSLDAEGNIASLEPAAPIKVQTPLGVMAAYDPDAIGVTADRNSLEFDKSGNVKALKSLAIVVSDTDKTLKIEPFSRLHPLDDYKRHYHPLAFRFEKDSVRITRPGPLEPEEYRFDLSDPPIVRPFIKHSFARLIIPTQATVSGGI
jgi:hypothetical protein